LRDRPLNLSRADPMTETPELLRFKDRLADLLARSEHRGRLSVQDYDGLLVDPGFDEDEFERFRETALARGIPLPEEEDSGTGDGRAPPAGPERDLLARYPDEIGRFPLLAHPELLKLAVRARAGDGDARRRIILANLRLVVHIARAYRNRGLP